MAGPGRGPKLPYKLLAGVEPCSGGWLVAGARLQGITLTPTEPEVLRSFVDVLDAKPAYTIISLHAPMGLLESAVPGGRSCDRAARRLLGFPRAGAIVSPPTRAELADLNGRHTRYGIGSMSKVRLRRIAEIDAEMQPYWQRTVFEVNPELGFFTLNADHTLRFGKRTHSGQRERRALFEGKLAGIERILDARLRGVSRWQLLDAAADLWTARRIAARAIARLPEDPEWDEHGLRMELIR